MTSTYYQIVAVAPMQPAGPCFATPIFRDIQTNASFFQRLSPNNLIDGFEEIDEGAEGRLRYVAVTDLRSVGQSALFAYLTLDDKIHIAEKKSFSEMLRGEFDLHTGRAHLRRSIAAFLDDPDLVATAQADVEAWRRHWRAQLSSTADQRGSRAPPDRNVVASPTDPLSASVIPFEIPESLRALAEKDVSQPFDNYARFNQIPEANNLAMEAFGEATKQYSAKLMEIIAYNAHASIDFAQEMASVRTPSEAMELWVRHTKKQYDTFTAQAKELADLGQKVGIARPQFEEFAKEQGAPWKA